MIRKMSDNDLADVINIWLGSNIDAHDFIDSKYWIGNKNFVKGLLVQAEVYVYMANEKVLGFIGLDSDYIAGLFVTTSSQSKGFGTQLLDYVKSKKSKLKLSVYKKNNRAVNFYIREGFKIIDENMDVTVNEKELLMFWRK